MFGVSWDQGCEELWPEEVSKVLGEYAWRES